VSCSHNRPLQKAVEVGKAGALSFVAGHVHKVEAPVRGTMTFDPEYRETAVVTIEVRTADLRVSSEGEPPEDVPRIQQTMTSDAVLDVAQYPTIAFHSTAVVIRQRRGAALDLVVTGDLTLHGNTNPVSIPMRADVTASRVSAQGTLSIRQSDYGIRPVRVGGGLVSVKDGLTVDFTIVAGALPTPPTRSQGERAPNNGRSSTEPRVRCGRLAVSRASQSRSRSHAG
jgi:polyisoprenoid-binding protein YceI